MRLRPDQIDDHLARQLMPIYVVSGDEPLQREECVDAIRTAARSAGHDERVVFHAERRFDWAELAHFGDALSLFATRRILEIRAPSKLDDSARKALVDYVARPPDDVVMLLILAWRVDYQMARAKWFSALEGAGAHVAVRPVAPD